MAVDAGKAEKKKPPKIIGGFSWKTNLSAF
jgi:hypothetical protein